MPPPTFDKQFVTGEKFELRENPEQGIGDAGEAVYFPIAVEFFLSGFFETHKLYDANTELTSARVWKGASETVSLGVAEDFYVTISRRHYKEMKAATIVDTKIMAPVKVGDQLGVVNVTLLNETVRSMPLIALNAVEKGSFIQRTYDSALMLIK